MNRREMKRLCLAFWLLVSGPAIATPAGSYVYVQTSEAVDIVDLRKLEKVGSLFIGDKVNTVVGSPDGRTIYVNVSLDQGHPQGRSHLGKVLAWSTQTEKLLWTAAIDGDPHYFAISQDGRKLFQPLWDRYWALVLDTQSGKIMDRWWGYVGLHEMRGSKDNRRAYAANSATGALYIYDSETGEQLAVHNNVRGGIRPFALNADESLMYMQVAQFHGFDVMDLKTGKIVKTVELPPLPPGTRLPQRYPYSYGHGMAISPDDKMLVAAASVANYVAAYSLPDLKLIKTIPTGVDPRQLLFTRDGRYLITANPGEETLGFIDAHTLEEVKRVTTSENPQFMTQVDVPGRER
jgi:DNA-binding beta-propeller fold protein YncE